VGFFHTPPSPSQAATAAISRFTRWTVPVPTPARRALCVRDFYDEDEIRRVYYREMEALVKAESGAKRVVVFDHTLRTPDQDLREAAKIPGSAEPYKT
jgi:hypothetical protein